MKSIVKSTRLPLLLCLSALCAAPALAQDGPYGATGQASGTYLETRLSSLEDQMRNLNGKIEQIDFAVRRLEQTVQRVQNDQDARLTQLEKSAAESSARAAAQPVAQPGVPLGGQTQTVGDGTDVTANGTLGALKMQNGRVTGGSVNPQQPALPNVPSDYGLTPQEQYDRAFNLLRQANYPEAEQAFKGFIDKNPKDKLIDNAKYWYGETLYVRAQFDAAAVAFADAYQTNPRGNKAPDSLLKLSLSLAALNKNADACVTLGELKSKYPTAPSTIKSRADDERARLKCAAMPKS